MQDRATKKQKELLEYIDTFIQEHGYGPSYREIMRALGYKSVSTVATHIRALIAKGLLEKGQDNARTLRVVREFTPAQTNEEAFRKLLEEKRSQLISMPGDNSSDIAAVSRVIELLFDR